LAMATADMVCDKSASGRQTCSTFMGVNWLPRRRSPLSADKWSIAMTMNKYLTLSLLAAGLSVSAAGLAATDDASTPNNKSQELFKTLDANEDGQLTAAEMAKLPALMRQRRFERLDANGDGKIDQEEFQARLIKRAERRFARLDKDGDGTLSADELTPGKRYHAHKSRKRSAHHGKHYRSHKRMSQRYGHTRKHGT